MPIPLIVEERVFYAIFKRDLVFQMMNLLSEDDTVANREKSNAN